jgi:hypothetical protein
MDQQAFELLQRRVQKLERRLLVAVAVVTLISLGFVWSMTLRPVSAQPRLTEYAGTMQYFTDSAAGATCYMYFTGGPAESVAMSCVK